MRYENGNTYVKSRCSAETRDLIVSQAYNGHVSVIEKATGAMMVHMLNILEDLYYGNLSPSHRTVRPDSRVKKLMQKQSDLESKLNGSFTEEQRENFEQ